MYDLSPLFCIHECTHVYLATYMYWVSRVVCVRVEELSSLSKECCSPLSSEQWMIRGTSQRTLFCVLVVSDLLRRIHPRFLHAQKSMDGYVSPVSALRECVSEDISYYGVCTCSLKAGMTLRDIAETKREVPFVTDVLGVVVESQVRVSVQVTLSRASHRVSSCLGSSMPGRSISPCLSYRVR